MGEFRDDIERTVDKRFKQIEAKTDEVSGSELTEKYGRHDLGDGASHFAVTIDGTPYVLTVTPLDQEQVDDYRPVMAVTEEVERLQRDGRVIPYHQVMVAPKGSVMLDLVPAIDGPQPDSYEGGMKFLHKFLDHDTVRPLL